jgi:DNA-directed RNA polymerase specialized sigma subunit
MSFKEIGKLLNITGWWASVLHDKGCKLLKEKINSTEFSDVV